MRLTMERLSESLKKFKPKWNGNGADSLCITSVCFFTDKTTVHDSDTLYLGSVSDLPSNLSPEVAAPFLCREDIPLPQIYSQKLHLILLPKGTDLNKVHEALLALFKEDLVEKDFIETLYRCSLKTDDIQKICDLAEEFLQNPIILLDRSLKHISEPSKKTIKDVIWVEQKQNGGYLSEEAVQLIVEQSGYHKDHYSTSPTIIAKGKLSYRRIICYIFVNARPIGTIVILESQRKFQKLDLVLAERLSEVLASKMKTNEFLVYSKGVAYEHLFKDLLDETISSAALQERIKSHHLEIGEDLYVLAMDISHFDRTYKTLQYFRDKLDQILEAGWSILYNHYIVIVIMRKNGLYLSSRETEAMVDFCTSKSISAGVSRCFHEISQLKQHFEQAVTALRLNGRINQSYRLAPYADFTIEHLLEIASEKADLRQFCDENLLKLMEYDTQNHTEFTHTLHVFLLQERNLAHTSQALHIHRNTLLYRVNKIQEILAQDLNDSSFRFQLLLSFRILGDGEACI